MTALALLTALLAGQAQPLSLEEALRQADAQNQDLAVSRARLERSRAATARAWAGYLPQLNVGGSYTRNSVEAEISIPSGFAIRDVGGPTSGPFDPSREPSPQNPPGAPTHLILFPTDFATATIQKQNQLAGYAELRQPIFQPALGAMIRNAQLSEQAQELQLEAVRKELLFGTAQAYLAAAGLKETALVQERMLQTYRAQEENARLKLEAGAVPRIDFVRARLDRVQAEQDLERTQIAYGSARSGLATLLAREPDFEVMGREGLRPELEVDPDSAQQAAQARPELRAAALGEDLAETARWAAKFTYLPTLNFTARYQLANVEGFTGQPDSWAAILSLNWALFDGGAREAQLREAKAAVAEARAQKRSTDLRVNDEVRRAVLELQRARVNREKSEARLKLAEENLELTRTAYDAGAATSLDVSQATGAQMAAELSQLNEALSAHLAALSLLRAAGAFDVSPTPLPSKEPSR
jgi:outer membrane protein TolC